MPIIVVLFLTCAGVVGLYAAEASAAGTTYYIDSSGGDNNNGGTTPGSAWQTIAKLNSTDFSPGDTILFKGGQSFSGNLYLTAADAGSSTSPVSIGSYGTGRATLNGGNSFGIYIYEAGGYDIHDLNVTGSGVTTNTGDGISFYNDLAGNVKLPHVKLTNIESSAFGKQGISIGGGNGSSGYSDVSISKVDAHDNARAGAIVYGVPGQAYANTGVTVGDSTFHDNRGVAGFGSNSGSGVILSSVDDGTIENSIAYGNGQNNDYAGGGPVGIWTWDSNNITIRNNESYSNRTASGDGGGFDLDIDVTNSIMEYNYSHDNDGAGYLLAHDTDDTKFSGNTVRYNISQSDGRKNNYAGIAGYGRLTNTEIYNNTVYTSSSASGVPTGFKLFNPTIETHDSHGLHVRNNIFYSSGNTTLLDVTPESLDTASDILFQDNDYYASGTFAIKWAGSTYSSLDAWRNATGQEKLSGGNIGFVIDPKLTQPGGGGTIGDPALLSSLTAYKLLDDSPLRDQGLNLTSLFGITMGSRDYYANTVPQHDAYDIGAHELPAPAGSTTSATLPAAYIPPANSSFRGK